MTLLYNPNFKAGGTFTNPAAASAIADVQALRRSVLVLRRRSKKPKGFVTDVFCRVLSRQADAIAAEAKVAS